MNSPAITWRVRKIGRELWSQMRARSKTGWLAMHATRAAIAGKHSSEPPTSAAAPRSLSWLASLRLDDGCCPPTREAKQLG
jgi:hypothetical protein